MDSLPNVTAYLTTPERASESERLLAAARARIRERGDDLLAEWARVEQRDANDFAIEHSRVERAHGFVRAAVRESETQT